MQFAGVVTRLDYCIGDITITACSRDSDVQFGIDDAARRFVAASGTPDVTLHVRRAAPAELAGAKLFDSGATWQLYGEGTGYVFRLSSPKFGADPYRTAAFDMAFSHGELRLNPRCFSRDTVVDPLEYPLAELLIVHLLARGRGVEIHGCGVVDADGRGYLFAGHSGAGKSTMARLWSDHGATVLSDDRIILRLRDDRVWMYGTPWHGEQGFASPGSAPLEHICFLEHGARNGTRAVNAAAAAARLFSRCFPPFHDRAGVEFTIELLAGIATRVPCRDLAFVPDGAVVGFVRDEL